MKPTSTEPNLTFSVPVNEELGSRKAFARALWEHTNGQREIARTKWLTDLESVAVWREKLLQGLSYSPESVPFDPQLLNEYVGKNWTRRIYQLQISRHDQTQATLYLPRGASAQSRVPVLLGLHDHGGQFLLGKEKLGTQPGTPFFELCRRYQEQLYGGQPPAEYFAANGFAVFTIDQLGFGSRALWQEEDKPYISGEQVITPEDEMRIRLRMRYEQNFLHRTLLSCGVTEAEICLRDNWRSIDFMETLPEIDASRIGAFGLSLGAMHCHQVAAFDKRIKASVRACWSGDFSILLEAYGPRVLSNHFLLPGVFSECHIPELVGLSVPNAVLILNGRQDSMYPFEAQEQSRREIEEVARQQGREDTVRWQYFDGPHTLSPPEQETALQFFQEFLG